MRFGIWSISTDDGTDPLEFARAAEDTGFESLWCSDHTHIPADDIPRSPQPPYGDLPREYFRIRDPFITLASVAAVTERIRLGTSVCIVPQREPIALAKQIATLDLVSGGRVLFGAGAGWNRGELRNHGVDPRTRMSVFREHVEAMRAIWTEEQAAYHGRFVDFGPLYSWPKPVQDPHPPVLIGGSGPTVLDRVLAFGDGWMPGHQRDLGALAARIEELRERAAASGRPRPEVTIVLARLERVETYADIGADRCVFMVPSEPRAATIGAVHELARALEL